MSRIMVTGATGLIGSVIAQQLAAGGHDTVALVREGTDATPIERLGVEIRRGDVTDAAAIEQAVQGCDFVIHSAAMLATPDMDPDAMHAVNVGGTALVLDQAAAAGVRRVVAISTGAAFDSSTTLTEKSPLNPDATDPYSATKRAAFEVAMERVHAGQDVCFVLPGATYGPSPMGERMVHVMGGNQRICNLLRGVDAEYLPVAVAWSYVGDVADVAIAALDRGVAGEVYLACGEKTSSRRYADFVNRAAEIAGIDRRVREVSPGDLDSPEVRARFPSTLLDMCARPAVTPYCDDSHTRATLGTTPIEIDQGIANTVEWIRAEGFA